MEIAPIIIAISDVFIDAIIIITTTTTIIIIIISLHGFLLPCR